MSGSIPIKQGWAVALHSCFALLDCIAEFCAPCVTFGEKKTSPITTVVVTVDRIDATGHLLSWVLDPRIRSLFRSRRILMSTLLLSWRPEESSAANHPLTRQLREKRITVT